jgi:peptidoglycan/LPS O-acetylase OafA/YrhL
MVIGEKVRPEPRLPTSDSSGETAPGDTRFRRDIQGLRAVAVVLVVLFHAHVPGLGGGYVGVDVFFVISGFVITQVLLREHASAGSTSLLRFWGRRARRIIPAATLVIIATVIASYIVLGPLGGNQAASDGRWASVFLVNFHFAADGTNYLSSLHASVLQNYWSLAVEEQFYLVYPIVFLVVAGLSWRFSLRARLGVVLGVVAIGSLVDSVIQTSNDPTAAYFLPYPRVWELALGGLMAVAAVALRRVPATIGAALSWLGLISILLAASLFSSTTAYPGWAVSLPVVGAALVIGGGTAPSPYGVEGLLRLQPFQWIGLISYSLYLWHWPVLAIATQRAGSDSLPVPDALVCVALSLGLAIASYVVVENPIRHSRSLITRRWASVALGACLIATSLTFTTVELHLHDKGSTLATPGLAGLKTSAACPPPSAQQVTTLMGDGPKASHRVVARLLVVGDSTACTMLPGLTAVAAPLGVQVEDAAVIGCGVVSGTIAPSVVNGSNVNAATRLCQKRAKAAQARALRSGPPTVVLWASTWERSSLVVGSGAQQRVLVADSPQWTAVLMKRMKQAVGQFTATGATVVMLTQPPFVDLGHPAGPTAQDRAFERLNALVATFAANRPHVTLVDLAAYVCPSGPPCPLIVGNEWARGDGDHYTADGSLWVARWLLPHLGIKGLRNPTDPLPTMRIVAPTDETVLGGVRGLSAVASFNVGVSKVEFLLSGQTLTNVDIGTAVFTKAGWVVSWNTKSVPNGTYTLRSAAYNAAGGRSMSKAITVRVAN